MKNSQTDPDQFIFNHVQRNLVAPKYAVCNCCKMRTMYFAVEVDYIMALKLIAKYEMISFPTSVLGIIHETIDPDDRYQRGATKSRISKSQDVRVIDAEAKATYQDPAIVMMGPPKQPTETYRDPAIVMIGRTKPIMTPPNLEDLARQVPIANGSHKYSSKKTSFHVDGVIRRLGNREFVKLRRALKIMNL